MTMRVSVCVTYVVVGIHRLSVPLLSFVPIGSNSNPIDLLCQPRASAYKSPHNVFGPAYLYCVVSLR